MQLVVDGALADVDVLQDLGRPSATVAPGQIASPFQLDLQLERRGIAQIPDQSSGVPWVEQDGERRRTGRR